MDVGRITACVVLSIPSGQRLGLDADSVVVAGRVGIGARVNILPEERRQVIGVAGLTVYLFFSSSGFNFYSSPHCRSPLRKPVTGFGFYSVR